MAHGLSKSRLLAFHQCPKRLWLHVHRRDLEVFSGQAYMAFQRGFDVGAAARSLYPEGILIDTDDPARALAETRHKMADRPATPLFEAAFEFDGVLARTDLLIPEGEAYRLVEVKAGTRVRDYHFPDCAVQAWVCREAGVPVSRTELAHVDTQFVYPGGGDFRGLLKPVDLTDDLAPLIGQVPVWIAEARMVLDSREPAIAPGPQCLTPFACPFLDYCARDRPAPEEVPFPLGILPYGGALIPSLRQEGYRDLREVPPDRLKHPRHQRMQRVALNAAPELDPAAADTLRNLSYPRRYLDFESIQFAVPIWPGTRPYEQLVFQWSCHIETAHGELRHAEFLDDHGDDPRRRFAESLLETMGCEGPILVYNQAFESYCLRALTGSFPDLANRLLALLERLVDLLPIARQHYYHPDMNGSWSLKRVLPTIAPELAYDDLDVPDGGTAQEAYAESIHPETPRERRLELRQGLLDYCRRDTLALVCLARYFEGRPAVVEG